MVLQPNGVATVGGVVAKTRQRTSAQVCVVPALGAASSWASSKVVRGQHQDALKGIRWQGWFSESYGTFCMNLKTYTKCSLLNNTLSIVDDAWEASTLVYDAPNVRNGSVFAWLLVPSSQPASCDQHSVTVLSVTSTHVEVAVSLSGAPVRKFSVAFA